MRLYRLTAFKMKPSLRKRTIYIFIVFFIALYVALRVLAATVFNPIKIQNKFIYSARNSNGNVLMQYKVFPRGGDDLKFDQPWPILSSKIYHVHELDESSRYIIGNFSFSAGLGNLMFQYAALRSFADAWNSTLIVPSDCLLRRAFSGLSRIILMESSSVEKILNDAGKLHSLTEFKVCCRYEPLRNPTIFNNSNIAVFSGYFQSYRYFHPEHKDLIHAEFEILQPIRQRADEILRMAKAKRINFPDESDGDDFTFIGVHVRHGMDITLHSRNLRHGHVAAPAEYYESALNMYRAKYKKLIFIVISDVLHWAKANIKSHVEGELHFPNSGYREVDLALIAQCNHTIISTGTFSWWGAYLSGGSAMRYGGWPVPGSDLDNMVEVTEYFLPQWNVLP